MKINLLKRAPIKYRRKELIKRINLGILVIGSSLFALSVLYISGRYIYLTIRANSLKDSTDKLTKVYVSRADEVVNYVRVKQIASAIVDIQSKQFKYKEFLGQVYGLLPANSSVISIDFATKNVILVAVKFNTIGDYETFNSNLKSASQNTDFMFKNVVEKQLILDSSGNYQINLEIGV